MRKYYIIHVDVCVQERDVREGADMLMVKPGMAYLDIVRQTKDRVSNHLSLSSQPRLAWRNNNLFS